MAAVYLFDEIADVSPSELNEAIELLPDWRREQALCFRHEQGRKECAFSYLLLCCALCEQYGFASMPEFERGEHGKPTIAGRGDVHFNMSHCKSAVACVVSDEPVGIDVECVGRYREALARHTMSDEEMSLIVASENPDLEFTKLWTRKEALVKLTGEGITDDLKTLLTKSEHFGYTKCKIGINYVLNVTFSKKNQTNVLKLTANEIFLQIKTFFSGM